MNILSRCIILIVSGKVLIRSIQITPGGYNICKSLVVPRETSQVKFVHEGLIHIRDQVETVIKTLVSLYSITERVWRYIYLKEKNDPRKRCENIIFYQALIHIHSFSDA